MGVCMYATRWKLLRQRLRGTYVGQRGLSTLVFCGRLWPFSAACCSFQHGMRHNNVYNTHNKNAQQVCNFGYDTRSILTYFLRFDVFTRPSVPCISLQAAAVWPSATEWELHLSLESVQNSRKASLALLLGSPQEVGLKRQL